MRAEYDFSSAKKNSYAVKPDQSVSNAFVDSAKVMAKGQITIPKDVREVLGVSSGDRVSFVVEGNAVRLFALFALLCVLTQNLGRSPK